MVNGIKQKIQKNTKFVYIGGKITQVFSAMLLKYRLGGMGGCCHLKKSSSGEMRTWGSDADTILENHIRCYQHGFLVVHINGWDLWHCYFKLCENLVDLLEDQFMMTVITSFIIEYILHWRHSCGSSVSIWNAHHLFSCHMNFVLVPCGTAKILIQKSCEKIMAVLSVKQ